jgi:hypothetical protein
MGRLQRTEKVTEGRTQRRATGQKKKKGFCKSPLYGLKDCRLYYEILLTYISYCNKIVLEV